MDKWNALAQSIESVATALALLVGGWWTWRMFVRQRFKFPKVDALIAPQVLSLSSGRLVRVSVDLRNVGTVVATSESAELRLRGVVPLQAELEEALKEGRDPVDPNKAQLEWPLLQHRQWSWKAGGFEIEPGESDVLYADFFLASSWRVVELYFYLANSSKKPKEIGWQRSQIIELTETGGEMVEEKKDQGKEVHTVEVRRPTILQQGPLAPQERLDVRSQQPPLTPQEKLDVRSQQPPKAPQERQETKNDQK